MINAMFGRGSPCRAAWLKDFLGDLARPFAIYSVAAAEATAIFKLADAGVITAGGVVLAALYASKTIEVQQAGKHETQVKVAEAKAATAAALGPEPSAAETPDRQPPWERGA
jgi:hypothetical protein